MRWFGALFVFCVFTLNVAHAQTSIDETEKLYRTFSSKAEQDGALSVLQLTRAAFEAGELSEAAYVERSLLVLRRVALCHGDKVDPEQYEDGLVDKVVGAHYRKQLVKYCIATSKLSWTDFQAMRTELRLLEIEEKDSFLGMVYDTVTWPFRKTPWLLGILATLVGIGVGLRKLSEP